MVKRFNAQFALLGEGVFQPDAYFDLDQDARRYVCGQLLSNSRLAVGRLGRGRVFDTVSGEVVFTTDRASLKEKSETSPKGS